MRAPKAAALAAVLVASTLPLVVSGTAGAAKTESATVKVKLLEFQVKAKPASVKPGDATFKVKNIGGMNHELVVARGDATTLPLAADGSVDDAQLAPDVVLGAVRDVAPKKSAKLAVTQLAPGEYTLYCNIVETVGDTELSHYAEGMFTTFTVR